MTTRRYRNGGGKCLDCYAPISDCSRGRCQACANIARRRPMPSDFPEVIRRLGSKGAAKHYNCSLSHITEWRRKAGLRFRERMRPSLLAGTAIAHRAHRRHSPRAIAHLARTCLTQADEAAEFLRKFGAVYRCTPEGIPSAKGSHWKRNFTVLNDEEIIGRAARLGWGKIEL